MTMLIVKTYKNGQEAKAKIGQLTQANINFLISLASQRFNNPDHIDHDPRLAGGVERVQIYVVA